MGPREDPTRTREIWSRLHAELRGRGLDEHAAEDLTQETWLRALRRPPAPEVPLAAWLFGVARRLRLESARGERHRREREHRVARPEHVAAAEIDEQELPALLAELRAPYGQVLAWRFLDELEVADIARRTGRSEATVRSQVSRGLELLRERLGPRRRRWLGGWIPSLRRPRPAWALAGLVALAVPALLVWRVGPRPRDGAALTAVDGARRDVARVALEPGAAPTAATARAPLALTPTTLALAVRVVDPRGHAVPGAVVRSAPDLEGPTRREGTCDADGRLALPSIDAERWVWAEAPGLWSSPRVLVASASGLGHALDLPLRRSPHPGTLRVVDSRGAPVPHARVLVDSFVDLTPPILAGQGGTLEVAPDEREFLADATGAVTIPWPVRDRFRVRAEGRGQAVTVRDWSAEEAAAARELRLDPALTVHGVTLDANGAPLGGALVEAFQRRHGIALRATSGAQGRFTLAGLAPGPVELVAGDGGARGARAEVELTSADDVLPALVLLEGQALHGTLRGPGGAPLAGRRVDWIGPGQPGAERGAERWTTTDEHGHFAFGGLANRTPQRLAIPGPTGTFPPAARLAGLLAGARPLDIEVAANERPRAPLTLAFAGTPAPHAVALRTGDATRIVLPEAPGRFRTPPLPDGDYEVVAIARTEDGQLLGPWRAGTLRHAVSAPAEQRLDAPRAGLLRVTRTPAPALCAVHVALPGFVAPVPGSEWSVQRRVVLAPDVAVSLCALVAGEHVVAILGGAAERHERLRVTPGGTTVLALDDDGGRLARLRLVAGRPLDPAEPLAMRVDTPTGQRELTLGARGRAIENGLELTVTLPADATAVEVLGDGLAGHASLAGPAVLAGPARLVEVRLAPR